MGARLPHRQFTASALGLTPRCRSGALAPDDVQRCELPVGVVTGVRNSIDVSSPGALAPQLGIP